MADPRVFISYSHDSDAHSEAVLQLAQQLRVWGVEVQLDRFVPAPPEGWPRWMMTQVDAADLVILVCTAVYRRRFEGQEARGKGKGVAFESLLAIQHIYDASTCNTKFVPVVLDDATEDAVPLVLRPYTRFRLPEQFEQFYRRLTGQPEVVAAPLGPRKVMPPRATMLPVATSGPPDTSASVVLRPALTPAPVRSEGGLDVAATPLDALYHLLLGLFGSGENFRQWVARGPDGPRLVAEFPSGTASTLIFGGIEVLERHGYLAGDFFTRLGNEFARRRGDIDRVAAAWVGLA